MFDVVINFWAVAVAGLAAMVVGALWYSPWMFGEVWMKLSGLSKSDLDAAKKKGMSTSYFGNLVTLLVMAWVLAMVLAVSGAANVSEAFQVTFWIWLGFIGTVTLNGVWWANEKAGLWALKNAGTLVGMLVMAAILMSWPV